MNKDTLIREYRNRAATWHAVGGVYAIIIGGMVLSASAIL
jgi:hypothetical protein